MNINNKNTKIKKCNYKKCKIKLNMLDFNCGCGGKYCLIHRLPESHNCIYNYKEFEKNKLSEKLLNEKTINVKIENKL
jgi:hypothetical protein